MTDRSRRRLLVSTLGLAAVLTAGRGAQAGSPAGAPLLRVYRSPLCGCCGAWVEHMRAAGSATQVTNLDDLAPVKARLGVPADLEACHTGLIDGYVVEGHVPAADVRRLLALRPRATGLAVPGMPVGSPGMEQGARRDAYDVLLFAPAGRQVFARH